MKNFTPKALILASALLAGAEASAQTVPGFAKAEWSSSLYQLDRPGYCLGDYNNDGFMDFYNCGLSNTGFVPKEDGSGNQDGYWPYGFLYKNINNESFEKPSTDRDEQYIMLSGVPSAVYSEASFVDFNNDGYLDLFIVRPYESDYGWMPSAAFYNPEENRKATEVYINLGPDGDYKFKRMEGLDLPVPCGDESCKQKVNEGQKGSVAFGDYDKDGYIDILMTGMEDGHKRFVYLYKNLAGQGFEKQLVANMKEGDTYDLGLYVMDELGLPTEVPSKQFKPMSHGSVAFADLDNDGWLDIICTGYSDDRGIEFRTYRNLQNGEFQDVTEDYAKSNIYRIYENQLNLVDINKDGYLDIINLGTPNADDRGEAGGRKLASILINNGAEAPFTFTEKLESETGLAPVSAAQVFMADFNGDGYADLLYRGWNNDCGWNTFLATYKRSQSQFVIDDEFSHQGTGDITTGAGFDFGNFAVGDFNGDGQFDMIEGGYPDHTNVWLNERGEDVSEAPVAPTDLATSVSNGVLTITWNDDNNEEYLTYYNIHITDADGKLVAFTTSALDNGKLTSYPEFATLVRSRSYSMALPKGEYTVKVSAVNHTYQSSEFATVNATVSDEVGVEKTVAGNIVVKALENGILVSSTDEMEVDVYTIGGQSVATGVTNQLLPVNANGIYLVKVAGKTYKVVKL